MTSEPGGFGEQHVRPGRDRSWRYGLSSVNTVLAGLAAVMTVLAGWASSVPGSFMVPGLIVVLAWLAVGAAWLVVATVALVVHRREHRELLRQPGDVRAHHSRSRFAWSYALVPLLLLLQVVNDEQGWTRNLRFELDRDELESYVAEVRSGSADVARPPRRIGTLPVEAVENRDGCVLVTIKDAGFLSHDGYAHCLGPVPDDEYDFWPVGGGWYRWSVYAGPV